MEKQSAKWDRKATREITEGPASLEPYQHTHLHTNINFSLTPLLPLSLSTSSAAFEPLFPAFVVPVYGASVFRFSFLCVRWN